MRVMQRTCVKVWKKGPRWDSALRVRAAMILWRLWETAVRSCSHPQVLQGGQASMLSIWCQTKRRPRVCPWLRSRHKMCWKTPRKSSKNPLKSTHPSGSLAELWFATKKTPRRAIAKSELQSTFRMCCHSMGTMNLNQMDPTITILTKTWNWGLVQKTLSCKTMLNAVLASAGSRQTNNRNWWLKNQWMRLAKADSLLSI